VFLREARRVAPDVTRILLTGQSDLDAAISAVNDGQLFRFLTKPCEPEELLRACTAGLLQHRLVAAERLVLEQTLKGSVQALVDVLALSSPAVFGRAGRVRASVARFARALELTESWEFEVAAMLSHLGAVTLPDKTAERLYCGEALSPAESAMVERVPASTRHILANIPRLDGVTAILENYRRPVSSESDEQPLPLGARILRIALDYDLLEAGGTGPEVALTTMRCRAGVYDEALLGVFARVAGVSAPTGRVLEIPVSQLHAGMSLADDVRSVNGSLLIARGQTVTPQLLERLVNLGSGHVREPLLAIGPTANV
jgi:hypothetical protein